MKNLTKKDILIISLFMSLISIFSTLFFFIGKKRGYYKAIDEVVGASECKSSSYWMKKDI